MIRAFSHRHPPVGGKDHWLVLSTLDASSFGLGPGRYCARVLAHLHFCSTSWHDGRKCNESENFLSRIHQLARRPQVQ